MPVNKIEARRAAIRKHYSTHKEWYYERNRKLKARIVEAVREAKSGPCADCGVGFPYFVMDLDHRPGEEKMFNLSAAGRSKTWKQVTAELAKCDAVCANCHRIRTWGRMETTA